MNKMNDDWSIRALCHVRTNEEAAEIISGKYKSDVRLTPGMMGAGIAQCILTNDVATLRKYFAAGANPNGISATDNEPLFHHACTTGNIAMVDAFLEAGVDLRMMDSTGGFTAMHAAVLSRDRGMILYMTAKLVEAGFDYHSLMQEALFTAVYMEDPVQVQILLDTGVDPDVDTWHGHRFHPSLLEAVRQHNKQIAELLIEYEAIKGEDCVELKCLLAGEDY
ncbi:MAG: ankyrin repeat domain-containing protein [Mailhella sp.]|nr:ankyrin repeat domain-containing protein [Mailhella sp.]